MQVVIQGTMEKHFRKKTLEKIEKRNIIEWKKLTMNL